MEPIDLIMTIPASFRIVVIVLLAVFAYFAVQGLKRLSRWILTLGLEVIVSTTENFVGLAVNFPLKY